MESADYSAASIFRLFTKESITRIEQAVAEEKERKQREKDHEAEGGTGGGADGKGIMLRGGDGDGNDDDKPQPDPNLEAGKVLPAKFHDIFPPEYFGKPIEDIDEYYKTQHTFMVVAKDKNIYRFSATNALFILSPFNPLRRASIYILTHQLFSMFIMLIILLNCGFMASNQEVLVAELFSLFIMVIILGNCAYMAINKENAMAENIFLVIYTFESLVKMPARGFIINDFTYLRDPWNWLDFLVVALAKVFTAIYTVESLIKISARGFIIHRFTYLRDAWNWLDFIVVTLAYVTMLVDLGNLAALRTFRVLRALKTVAVVPGLKTIVGALMEAVRRLRDVIILSLFVLSIFALVGLQIYQGVLLQKCIVEPPEELKDIDKALLKEIWFDNETNWLKPEGQPFVICGGVSCPDNYTCERAGENPNFGYTSFDNFGWALLCAFRLMTQDYWENLYQNIIRAMGPWHVFFFVLVIFMGSFYLVNLILAIVAMSYDEQQKQDQEDLEAEEEEEEERRQAERDHAQEMLQAQAARSPSEVSMNSGLLMVQTGGGDRISIHSELGLEKERRLSIINRSGKKASLSLPGSPFTLRRGSRASQFSWKKKGGPRVAGDKQPLVLPCLDHLNFPYADDSRAVTPSIEDLCNPYNTQLTHMTRRRLSSAASFKSNASHHGHFEGVRFVRSRRSSFTSDHSRFSDNSKTGELLAKRGLLNRGEPTHFYWHTKPVMNTAVPDVIVDRTRSDDNVSSSSTSEFDAKAKLFPDNPFICRTPSANAVDFNDVMIMRELINQTTGHRGSFMSDHMSRKEWLKQKCLHILFGWECCPCWHRFAHYVELFIMDAFVDLFITLCIVVNTIFMALDQYNMNATLTNVLTQGNYVFTTIFTAEAVLKLIALSPINYLKDKWNCFDIVIVILSLVELGLSGVKGLSILRSFRLLRVFKLAKSWPTLNLLIGIVGRTMGALGNLCFVLLIIVFIFAVMGMQLFGDNYKKMQFFPNGEPRWNFLDFLHSFMIIFRVLCGEWIESMWECMHCGTFVCVPFFLLSMVIGNLVVLNLFLALLLSSFGAESLQQSQDDSEPNKLQEAVERINRFTIYIKSKINYVFRVKIRKKAIMTDFPTSKANMDGVIPLTNGRIVDRINSEDPNSPIKQEIALPPLRHFKGTTKSHVGYSPVSPFDSTDASIIKDDDLESRGSQSTTQINRSMPYSPSTDSNKSSVHSDFGTMSSYSYSRDETVSIDKPIDTADGPEINEVNVVFVRYPDECFPLCCTTKCTCCNVLDKTAVGKIWWTFRCYMFKLVEHKYFETFIIVMIIASSLALAVEDRTLSKKPNWKLGLYYMDKAFTLIFVCEMLIKWFAFGFKKYFTDAWCWLDFVIVAVSLVSLAAEGIGMSNIGAFKALRTLRALRPLRAVSRWEGMKVVVNALIGAIPAIANVLIVCLVFWLIFAIMGVQLFAGRFGECLDENWERLNTSIVKNKKECDNMTETHNFTWVNPKINFDNVLMSYLCLLQVATFKGWIPIIERSVDSGNVATFKGWTDIMYDAIDSQDATFKGWTFIMEDAIDSPTEMEMQPEREIRVAMYFYFVLFIVFGSFFTLNLFIGVIIDNFNMQKKKIRGSLEMFMTEDQKKYYNAMKKLGSKQPQKPIPKPRLKCQLFFFKVTTNQKFDIAIMSVIMLNMVTMALEHYEMDETFASTLHFINIVFIAIFTLECAMKIIGLRYYYFKQPWNIFDFIVVVLSILGLCLADFIQNYFVSPTLLRVVRVFRVGRVLRLVKSAKGIRTLLFSLAVSIPALFNIGLLLVMIMFIYAIFGMNFFMYTQHSYGIDAMFNFETFFSSMIVLFQICTSAGWDSILAGLMNTEDCHTGELNGEPSNCGQPGMAILYLVSYLIVSFLVVINMYIAVILENFSQATEDVQQGLTQDDFDMYYEVWEKFDEKASQYIPVDKLCEFVNTLEEPLRLPEPNLYKLISLDITICEDDKVHCVDILDALTKNFLGTGGDSGELGDIKKGPNRKDYVPYSSTLKRQREIVCARIIQRCWKNFVKRKKEARRLACVTEEEGEETPSPETIIDMEPGYNLQEAGVNKETGETVLIHDESKTVELHPHSDVVA